MGVIHVRKDGMTYQLDEDMTVEDARRVLGLPPNSVLINARGERITGRLRGQVRDGESIAAFPDFRYW